MQNSDSINQNTLHVNIKQDRSKRFLTIVSGIPTDLLEKTAKTIKKKLACAGTVRKETNVVEFSGDHSFNIKEILKQLIPNYEVEMHGQSG